MRPMLAVPVLAGLALSVAHAARSTSLEEFQGQIAERAGDPKAAVKLWFDAVYVYIGGNQELGEQLITEMSRYKDWKATQGYFTNALDNKPHILRSYANGATPENKYTMDPEKAHVWRSYVKGTSPENGHEVTDIEAIEVQTRFQSGEEPTADSRNIRMFCHSTGADNDRPLKFERDSRGQWRITEFSSMCLGVRPPKDPKAVDF